ncbi:MAG TPA: Holliday junction branch migration protein RuvA [Edaphocola sp.]|nr:Holliday junction branch migration protein RuvA [Edaphocola sp.]
MIGYIKGKIVGLNPSQTYIDINGLGYDVNITLNTYEQIKDKEEALLFTHLQVREDAWVLYGFATEEERESFQKLLSVSGVGAATSRILLSSISSAELAKIINHGDSASLQKVKGIGAKTAQRIILELKGKLELKTPDLENNQGMIKKVGVEEDALRALLGLGIPKANAEKAIKLSVSMVTNPDSVEELIKTALKNI